MRLADLPQINASRLLKLNVANHEPPFWCKSIYITYTKHRIKLKIVCQKEKEEFEPQMNADPRR